LGVPRYLEVWESVRPLRLRQHQGFTLVELLLVIALLAIIAFLAIPRIIDSVYQSRLNACGANVCMLDEAIVRYRAEQVAENRTPIYPWPVTEGAVDEVIALTDPTQPDGWGATIEAEYKAHFKPTPRCPFGGSRRYEIVYTESEGHVTWTTRCSPEHP